MTRKSKMFSRALVAFALLLLVTAVLACGGQPAADTDEQAPAGETGAEAEPTAAAEGDSGDAASDDGASEDTAGDMSATEGEELVRTLNPDELPEGWEVPQTVGHVTNYLVHEWYQNLTAGEEVRAEDYGIEFSINDANLDLQQSLAAASDYMAQNIDVLVFTPVDAQASAPTLRNVRDQGIPIVCESTITEGCTTLVAIDDYQAGYEVGVWAGEYAQENFDGEARALDIGLPALPSTVNRSEGFADGLHSVLPEGEIVQSVDGQGLKDEAVSVAADALTANPDINIIFGINDDSALGGLQAYTAAGLDTSNLLVVGFGCEGNACKNALEEGGPYKVSAAMFPEYQGRLIIDAAVAVFNDTPLPEHLIAPSTPMTQENMSQYYTKEGDSWTANFDAIAEIPIGGNDGD